MTSASMGSFPSVMRHISLGAKDTSCEKPQCPPTAFSTRSTTGPLHFGVPDTAKHICAVRCSSLPDNTNQGGEKPVFTADLYQLEKITIFVKKLSQPSVRLLLLFNSGSCAKQKENKKDSMVI